MKYVYSISIVLFLSVFSLAIDAYHVFDTYNRPYGQLSPYGLTRQTPEHIVRIPTSTLTEVISLDRGLLFDSCKWDYIVYGYADAIFDYQHGWNGDKKFFSLNEFLASAYRDVCGGTLHARALLSLEPGTVGKCGYPLLFATGGTADCITLLCDRFHTRDFFSELALTYAYPVKTNGLLFGYVGYPGVPCLGPLPEQLISSFYIPEGRLTQKWLDSAYTSFGVITGGFQGKRMRIEGSVFTGNEPDEKHWGFERPHMRSASARISVFPTHNWIGQVGYGFIHSPDQLEPDVDIHRITATVSYLASTDTTVFQVLGAWGINIYSPGDLSNALLLESSFNWCNKHILFGRFEHVEPCDLLAREACCDAQSFMCASNVRTVNKLLGGYRYQIPTQYHLLWSAGFSAGVALPDQVLERAYGRNLFSYFLFVRVELI